MWKRIKNSRTAANMEKFRKLRQHLKNWIRLERRNYVKNIADEIHSNSKRFWSYFAFKNKAKPIPDKLTYNNTTFSDDRARAEAFNDFFKSVYKDHSRCQVTFDEPVITDNSLCHVQVSVEEISKILSSLDVHKAIGPDKLPTIVLKECAESLAPSVTAVVNFGLRTGLQLTEWKKANVPPIHKKGKKDLVENYRPVSLLSVISKVQERCLVTRLVPHVQEVLYTYQHGFQKGKSCVTQLLEVFHEIGCALDRGFESDIIYLDFAKAFDSVCPAKLVSKLKAFGIGDPLLKWFQSYLTERKQRVVVNGTYSAWTDVGSGVPQGSLLGPILFLLFVNDMPRVVENASLAMFADDSKCYKVIYQESDFVNLQRDLDALSTWSVSNELFFQPTKCVNLRISRKRNSPSRNYSLNGFSLEVVKAEKDLGVLISSDMTWKDHIIMVVAKANKMLGFLKRNCAGLVNREALLRLYHSLVRSHVCFCSQVWAPQSTVNTLFLVEGIQRRASRFIVGKGSDLSYRDRLIKLRLLPLNYWLEYLDLVFFYKCLNSMVDFTFEFDHYFSFVQGRTRRANAAHCVKTNYARTSLFRDYFFNRITIIWNGIPEDIKVATTLCSFKRQLKSFYFKRLYNVFDGDNVRSFKIICPKCRRVNILKACSC